MVFIFHGTSTLPGVNILGFQGSGRNPVQRIGVSLFSLVSIMSYAYILYFDRWIYCFRRSCQFEQFHQYYYIMNNIEFTLTHLNTAYSHYRPSPPKNTKNGKQTSLELRAFRPEFPDLDIDCQSSDKVIRFDYQARPHRTSDPLSRPGLADSTKPIISLSNKRLAGFWQELPTASWLSKVRSVRW